MRELREAGTFNTVVAQVEEDNQAQDKVTEIMRREKETTAAVKQLEADLAREKLEHQREVQEQKAVIADLKEKLQQIKSKTSTNTKYARREARAKTNSTLRSYQQLAWEQQEQHLAHRRRRHMSDVEAQNHDIPSVHVHLH